MSRMKWASALALGWSVLSLSACEQPAPPDLSPEPEVATTPSALGVSSSYLDLRMRTGTGVASGMTCGSGNEVAPSCASGASSDFNFHWVAPYDGAFTFSTRGNGTTYDTVVQVTRWVDSVVLGCNDDFESTPQSSVTVSLGQNQQVRVSVDGKGASCGSFQLDITGVPSTCGACNTPPSACHDPNGYCYNAACQYNLKPAGSACDDGNTCTTNDTCGSSGTCQGTALLCDSPPGVCYQGTGSCSNGKCTYLRRPAGSSCDDGDSCTSGDACTASGFCASGTRVCCPNGTAPCNGSCCGTGSYCSGGTCVLCSPNEPYLVKFPTCMDQQLP
ncbi:hypothetical protein LZ198_39790 [Myxococcus sp. K15C18031901]|uniref:hypothetical protein n=1 Tax=Myxococcus dinghuensis TaxID=2906761 RepID=UPI0020A80617|nr:hypothetical protein [Myxococcus dinghuensis]MCP3105027.1 hypothetical protein [Myxococcus dinghuensis]